MEGICDVYTWKAKMDKQGIAILMEQRYNKLIGNKF